MDDYKRYFVEAAKCSFPEQAAILMSRTNAHYLNIKSDTSFAATSKNPIDKRLDFSAYFLSFIKALDEQGEPFHVIRTICLDVVTEYVKPRNKIQQFLKRLPPKLLKTWFATPFLVLFNKRVSKKGHPDGFLAEIITDKQETFGFGYGIDILECGICKLFQKHRYQKYASILCEVDEITSGLAGLTLIRTGTIALGAHKCDFRFK